MDSTNFCGEEINDINKSAGELLRFLAYLIWAKMLVDIKNLCLSSKMIMGDITKINEKKA